MTRDPIDDLMDHPAPIPDDGFTLRVMAALPPPRPAATLLDRWPLLVGAGAVVAALGPDLAELGRGLSASALRASHGAAQAFTPAAGAGALPWTLVLVAALAVTAAALGSWLVAEPA